MLGDTLAGLHRMGEIETLFDAAAKCHESGNLVGAERLYRAVLAAEANHAEAWSRLGLVAHAQGDAAATLELVDRAIACDASRPVFHLQRADVCRSLGMLPEAEASCREALAPRPISRRPTICWGPC